MKKTSVLVLLSGLFDRSRSRTVKALVFTAEQSISLALPFLLRSLLSLIKATKAPSALPSFLNRAVTGMHSVNPLIAAAVALEGRTGGTGREEG